MADAAWSAAWRRGQALIAARDRRVAAKNKKNSRGHGGVRPARAPRTRGARATRGAGGCGKGTIPLIYKQHQGGRAGDPYAEKKGLLIDTNMLSTTSRDRSEEWRLECLKAPNVRADRLIQHISLSRPEGGQLSLQAYIELVRDWLKNRGATGAFVAYLHTDTAHPHLHIVYSRVQADGSILSDGWDYYKGREAAHRTAEALKLDVSTQQSKELQTTSTSDAQTNASRRAARRGTKPNFIEAAVLHKAMDGATSMDQFALNLSASGIEMKNATAGVDNHTTGILFRQNGAEEWLAGSSISRQYSLQKIKAQIELNQQRTQEMAAMQRRQQQAAQQSQNRQRDR